MEKALTIETAMDSSRRKNISSVIGQFGKRLLGFIRQRVNTEADAEDILQDVWYQFSASAEPIEQVGSWLFTVARNRITDSYRKMKPELLEDILPGDSEDQAGFSQIIFDNSHHPEMAHLRGLFWDALNRALLELPDDQRIVFVQNELEDVPFKTIAENTGVPINTLISRKRYAVLHLRERLAELKNELLNY
ncbi:MAG: RNA polymerase sigma factor [Chitinophagales bacterium]